MTLESFEDETIGITEAKKSSTIPFGTNANSSRTSTFAEKPLALDDEVENALTDDLFENVISPLL